LHNLFFFKKITKPNKIHIETELKGIEGPFRDIGKMLLHLTQTENEVYESFVGRRNTRTCEEICELIQDFFSQTDKTFFLIYYSGHGIEGTGDWVFKDKELSFDTLMHLWENREKGHFEEEEEVESKPHKKVNKEKKWKIILKHKRHQKHHKLEKFQKYHAHKWKTNHSIDQNKNWTESAANPKKQHLLIITDCCFSGAWVSRAKKYFKEFTSDFSIQSACSANELALDFGNEQGGYFTGMSLRFGHKFKKSQFHLFKIKESAFKKIDKFTCQIDFGDLNELLQIENQNGDDDEWEEEEDDVDFDDDDSEEEYEEEENQEEGGNHENQENQNHAKREEDEDVEEGEEREEEDEEEEEEEEEDSNDEEEEEKKHLYPQQTSIDMNEPPRKKTLNVRSVSTNQTNQTNSSSSTIPQLSNLIPTENQKEITKPKDVNQKEDNQKENELKNSHKGNGRWAMFLEEKKLCQQMKKLEREEKRAQRKESKKARKKIVEENYRSFFMMFSKSQLFHEFSRKPSLIPTKDIDIEFATKVQICGYLFKLFPQIDNLVEHRQKSLKKTESYNKLLTEIIEEFSQDSKSINETIAPNSLLGKLLQKNPKEVKGTGIQYPTPKSFLGENIFATQEEFQLFVTVDAKDILKLILGKIYDKEEKFTSKIWTKDEFCRILMQDFDDEFVGKTFMEDLFNTMGFEHKH